jgi:glycosyltransferase involved in cell wall biosynthesis
MAKISIVIPTFKEAKYITRTLNNIEKLKGDVEVILVETVSDETVILEKIVEEHKNVQLYKIKERGIAKARNYGAKKARGSILLFLDADVLITRDSIEKILEVFENPLVCGATCSFYPVKPNFNELLFFKFYNALVRLALSLPLIRRFKHTSGTFIAVRKIYFDMIGGFSEHLACLEDGDLAYRLSSLGKFVFIKDMFFYESLRRARKLGLFKTVKSWFQNWLFYILTGNVAVEEWKPIR